MSIIPVNLAVEDVLSETVARRLLANADRSYQVGVAYGRRGYGYLRGTIRGWNRAARGVPFIVLTDLDDYPCPTALIREWLPENKSPNLLLRVAVREVEAWLLADRMNLATYLSVSVTRVPLEPDSLADAKASLVELAGRSRSRDVRTGIAPKQGSTAKQGPDYNASLSDFARSRWNIEAARLSSPSLARTIARLSLFTPVW
jgi:hypothetical protein